DSGQLDYTSGELRTIASIATGVGGADTITGDAGADIIVGGAGLTGAAVGVTGDSISGGTGDDLILGDEGTITLEGGVRKLITSTSTGTGDADTITGDDGNDVI